MARLSPADLWGLELIKKWKSLGNKNTLPLYKDTVSWLSQGFEGWAADKNNKNTLFCLKHNDLSWVLQPFYGPMFEHKVLKSATVSLMTKEQDYTMRDLNNTEVRCFRVQLGLNIAIVQYIQET